MKISIAEIIRLTGKKRETLMRRIADLPSDSGPKNAKLYESKAALEAVYIGDTTGTGEVSAAEAARRLTIQRTEEIALNMEVTRRTRIPVEDIETIVRESVGQAAGILKSSLGKVLTKDAVSDILAQLRDIPVNLRKKTDLILKA